MEGFGLTGKIIDKSSLSQGARFATRIKMGLMARGIHIKHSHSVIEFENKFAFYLLYRDANKSNNFSPAPTVIIELKQKYENNFSMILVSKGQKYSVITEIAGKDVCIHNDSKEIPYNNDGMELLKAEKKEDIKKSMKLRIKNETDSPLNIRAEKFVFGMAIPKDDSHRTIGSFTEENVENELINFMLKSIPNA